MLCARTGHADSTAIPSISRSEKRETRIRRTWSRYSPDDETRSLGSLLSPVPDSSGWACMPSAVPIPGISSERAAVDGAARQQALSCSAKASRRLAQVSQRSCVQSTSRQDSHSSRPDGMSCTTLAPRRDQSLPNQVPEHMETARLSCSKAPAMTSSTGGSVGGMHVYRHHRVESFLGQSPRAGRLLGANARHGAQAKRVQADEAARVALVVGAAVVFEGDDVGAVQRLRGAAADEGETTLIEA